MVRSRQPFDTRTQTLAGVALSNIEHLVGNPALTNQSESVSKKRKRPVTTVFLRQPKPVILEEWEVREARKY